MSDNNESFIQTVKVTDIPWHRLTTVYGRAANFPEYFDLMWQMESMETVKEAAEEVAINIEHQSTLWHATPFAMIFLTRILKYATQEMDKNDAAKYLFEKLTELFVDIAEGISAGEKLEHAEPLPDFSDMLKEEYLWSEQYDEEEDELRYDEGEVFPDDLFYSFYYYSKQVLLLSGPMFEEINGEISFPFL